MRPTILFPLLLATSFAAPPDINNLEKLTTDLNDAQRERFASYPHADIIEEDEKLAVFNLWIGEDREVAALTNAITEVILYIGEESIKNDKYERITDLPPVLTFTSIFDEDEVIVPPTVEGRLVDKPNEDEGKAYVVKLPLSYPQAPRSKFICYAAVDFKTTVNGVPTVPVFHDLAVNWIYPESEVPDTTVMEMDADFFRIPLGLSRVDSLCFRPKAFHFVDKLEKDSKCAKLEIVLIEGQFRWEDYEWEEVAREEITLKDNGSEVSATFVVPQGREAIMVVCTTDIEANEFVTAKIDFEA